MNNEQLTISFVIFGESTPGKKFSDHKQMNNHPSASSLIPFLTRRGFGGGQLIHFLLLIINCALFTSCFNPFSPRIDNTTSNENIITDQKTIEGVFQNFKYAYTFKDTTIYGQLLTEDFVFTYFDYDLGVDVSWDRPTDMRTTDGLFANTQDLKLIWNNIVFQEGDSVSVDVKRSFNLTITFNPNDVINFHGFVDMTIIRPTQDDKWRIRRWRDLTNP